MHNRKANRMKNWKNLTHYVGLDWAKDHRAVVIVNAEGHIVADFEFAHSLEGWKSFAEKISAWPNLAVAIETSQGAAVDQLLQREYTVFPVHPVSAQSYRERKASSGTETDHLDAWGLADALRVDGHDWKPLQPMDPMTQQLRLLCRDEVSLIEHHSVISSLKSSFAPLHRPPPQALPVQLEMLRFSQASLNCALINGTRFISVP